MLNRAPRKIIYLIVMDLRRCVERFVDFRTAGRFFFGRRVRRTRAGIGGAGSDVASMCSADLPPALTKAFIVLAAAAMTPNAIDAPSLG